jgi:asparagine synthase (glutamine-hydrolysing)
MARFLWLAGIVPMLPGPIYRHFQPFADVYGDGAFPSAELKALYQSTQPSTEFRLHPDADVYMRKLLQNGHIAERMATWAAWSSTAGFEYRYPLVDRHLLEFLLSLPPDIRFGDGSGRYLARRAFRALLPQGIKKNDVVNETLRQDNRRNWWRALAADVERGRFDAPCPWLDMEGLKTTLRLGPPSGSTAQVAAFARFFVAMRIQAMYSTCHSSH